MPKLSSTEGKPDADAGLLDFYQAFYGWFGFGNGLSPIGTGNAHMSGSARHARTSELYNLPFTAYCHLSTNLNKAKGIYL